MFTLEAGGGIVGELLAECSVVVRPVYSCFLLLCQGQSVMVDIPALAAGHSSNGNTAAIVHNVD